MRDPDILVASLTESELNDVIAGSLVDHASSWSGSRGVLRLKADEAGVLIKWDGSKARPLAFIVDESRHQRLFGRFAQVRTQFAPLSAWAHIIEPRTFERLDALVRAPCFDGLVAAWAGLVIAEAQILTGTPVGRIKISSCLATRSYALARNLALWPGDGLSEIQKRYEDTRRLLKSGDGTRNGAVGSLEPVWEILAQLTGSGYSPATIHWQILDSLQSLRRAESELNEGDRWNALWPVLDTLPGEFRHANMSELAPEQRLKLFDGLIASIGDLGANRDATDYTILTYVAGFLSTIAAGGAPSIGLAEEHLRDHPAILAWAYVVGGLGERVTWTSSFEGLGRLVARELERPLHLDEPPTSDFSYQELVAVVDKALSDPLVHLRIKQGRTVVVALAPGVNVVFPLSEQRERNGSLDRQVAPRPEARPTSNDPVAALVEAMWPYLERRIRAVARPSEYRSARPSRGRPSSTKAKDGDLPLGDPKQKK